MAISADQSVAGITALKAVKNNPYCRFNYAENDPHTAGWRMAQRAPVDVHTIPKFQLSGDDRIFTMGSCFARRVENSLISAGVKVLLSDFELPAKHINPAHPRYDSAMNSSDRGMLMRTVLNKYSPLSMSNEFERLLVPPARPDPFKGLIQVDQDRWFDPQIKNTLMLPLSDALEARACVEKATAKVLDATTIFLTLGFTESWTDAETNVVLNVAPPPALIRRWPERFRFHNATFSEIMDSLEIIYALITQRVRADMKFVVTVSPIPLGTTFTKMDIIAANAYSKATLRAAAGEFCGRYANVDYYPSYEMVTATNPELSWRPDWVHVRPEIVDVVIKRFVQRYFSSLDAAHPRDVAC